jgi:ABC-type uncharacterized transport system substrate-binding protein
MCAKSDATTSTVAVSSGPGGTSGHPHAFADALHGAKEETTMRSVALDLGVKETLF